jgi:hypothetical protein
VVVPQRRGEPRVVARVVPEPLRHYDDTRRASRTRGKAKARKRGGGGGGGGGGRNWEDDGRPRGRRSAAGVGVGGGGGTTKPRRREEGKHVAASPACRCRGAVSSGGLGSVARRGAACASRREAARARRAIAPRWVHVHVSLPTTIHHGWNACVGSRRIWD